MQTPAFTTFERIGVSLTGVLRFLAEQSVSTDY